MRGLGKRGVLGVRALRAGGMVRSMSENTPNPSEQPYDPSKDPDADPEQLEREEPFDQPSQAEGDETAGPTSSS